MQFYLADTHAIVWFLTGNPRLKATARQVFLNRNAHVLIAAATFEDLRKNFNTRLGRGGHSEMPPALSVLGVARHAKNVCIYPCDSAVVAEVLQLEHSRVGVTDPEDLQILATFLVLNRILGECRHKVTYVGNDSKIRRHLSRLGYDDHVLSCD